MLVSLVRFVAAFFVTLVLLNTAALAQDPGTPEDATGAQALPAEAQALLDVLRSEEARDALIAELERIGAEVPEAAAEVPQATAEEEVSFGRRIALLTQETAESVAEQVGAAWRGVQRAPRLFTSLVLRARIKTLPGKQWGVGRAYNQILKRIFDERGIEIPFPHQTVFFGEAKDGRTQKLRIASQDDAEASDNS